MAKNWKKGKGKKFDGVRITGLFKGKSKGNYNGMLKAEDLGDLRKLLKSAADQEKGVVFFLKRWEDVEEGQPLFSLSAAVAQPKKKSKDIEETDDDPEDDDEDDDSEESDDDEAEEEPKPKPKKEGKKPKPAEEKDDDGEDDNPF